MRARGIDHLQVYTREVNHGCMIRNPGIPVKFPSPLPQIEDAGLNLIEFLVCIPPPNLTDCDSL